MHSLMADSRISRPQLSGLRKHAAYKPPSAYRYLGIYIARSQWRRIDLNGALFAQFGGRKATLLRIKTIVRQSEKAASVRRVQPRGMSAVLPIASELLHRNETMLRAKRRNPPSSKAVTSQFAFAVVHGTHRRRISVA